MSKLDTILHKMALYYQAVALGKTPPNNNDFAKTKRLITQLQTKEEVDE